MDELMIKIHGDHGVQIHRFTVQTSKEYRDEFIRQLESLTRQIDPQKSNPKLSYEKHRKQS